MSLSSEYKAQRPWRPWSRIFDELPALEGARVLDLGCAVGDQTAELVARGASVIGFDLNEELLREAQQRHLPNAEFRKADLKALPDLGGSVDGIWSSFAAAYFPNLLEPLVAWAERLRPGGWIALTEVDDLFGHEPLSQRTRSLLDGHVRRALAAGYYDFHMGRKLAGFLEQAGLTISKTLELEDQELAFSGKASPEVIEAWRARFERMKLLRDTCGEAFGSVRDEFLACLERPDHRCTAKLHFCLAVK